MRPTVAIVQDHTGPSPQRLPLGDATAKVNNTRSGPVNDQQSSPLPKFGSLFSPVEQENLGHPTKTKLSVIANRFHESSSLKPSRGKTHVGPWKLGETLGEGATGHVRIARHDVTGQLAAIKIIPRKPFEGPQFGSLAETDPCLLPKNTPQDELMRMPAAVEREVAFLMMLDHPNVIRLYDVWGNHNEM
jgi:hypothetical protein